jgi:hypothetical protein
MLPVGTISSRTTRAAMLRRNVQARTNVKTTPASTGLTTSPVLLVNPTVRPSAGSTLPNEVNMIMPTTIDRGHPMGAPRMRRTKKATAAAVATKLRKLMIWNMPSPEAVPADSLYRLTTFSSIRTTID